MTRLPTHIMQKIHSYKPIEVDGLTFYPMTVGHYQDFLRARIILEFMQQSLPVAYVGIPLLSAFFMLDTEAIDNGDAPSGLFAETVLLLSKCLRLGDEWETPDETWKRFRVVVDEGNHNKLNAIVFEQDGETKNITPIMFQKIRPILALQNGVEIPDDDANPEIVAAEAVKASLNSVKVDISVEAMVHSIAALSRVDEEEVYTWAIKKLHDRMESYKRIIDYVVCGIGESQGTKWAGGNPAPSPWFNRTEELSSALVSVDSFMGGDTRGAIEKTGQRPDSHFS